MSILGLKRKQAKMYV